jgi:predicted lipase
MNKQKIFKVAAITAAVLVAGVARCVWLADAPYRERKSLETRIAVVESSIREQAANVHRERADCQADAIEFPNDQIIQKTCWDAFRQSKQISDGLVRSLQAERTKLQGQLDDVNARLANKAP